MTSLSGTGIHAVVGLHGGGISPNTQSLPEKKREVNGEVAVIRRYARTHKELKNRDKNMQRRRRLRKKSVKDGKRNKGKSCFINQK